MFQEQLDNLKMVFLRFQGHHLKLSPKKCQLFQMEVECLGRNHTPRVTVNPEKLKAVQEWPPPADTQAEKHP
jgi:hypothetical protein